MINNWWRKSLFHLLQYYDKDLHFLKVFISTLFVIIMITFFSFHFYFILNSPLLPLIYVVIYECRTLQSKRSNFNIIKILLFFFFLIKFYNYFTTNLVVLYDFFSSSDASKLRDRESYRALDAGETHLIVMILKLMCPY